MTKQISFIVCFVMAISINAQSISQENSIVKNASLSDSHKTLVTAVKAAGLVKTLDSKGPFTVFAPTDAAFDEVPKSTLKSLLKPANKEKLQGLLTYHVVEGDFKAKDVVGLIKKNDGQATVGTVNGGKLTLSLSYGDVKIKDQQGNTATVAKADLNSSNGVIHVVDKVLMP